MCLLEIAFLIFGIAVLIKGQISLGDDRIVKGLYARMIGLLLLCTPFLVIAGIIVGLFIAVALGASDSAGVWLFFGLEFAMLLLIVIACFIITGIAPKHDLSPPLIGEVEANFPGSVNDLQPGGRVQGWQSQNAGGTKSGNWRDSRGAQ